MRAQGSECDMGGTKMTFGRIVAITIAASVFALSATAQQPRNPRAEQTVSDAGYQPADQTALIRALLDANSSVASAAATLLARFPATTESITALNAAAGDPDEVRALAALTTLQFLGAKGWEPDALVRLANMKAGYKQITLAGILARVGRGEGWHFVRLAL